MVIQLHNRRAGIINRGLSNEYTKTKLPFNSCGSCLRYVNAHNIACNNAHNVEANARAMRNDDCLVYKVKIRTELTRSHQLELASQAGLL